MPEPVGDGTKVDARGEELRGNEVAKIVEPDVAETDLLAEPGPAPVTMSGRQGRSPNWSIAKTRSDSSRSLPAAEAVRAACAFRSTSASTACVVSDTSRGGVR